MAEYTNDQVSNYDAEIFQSPRRIVDCDLGLIAMPCGRWKAKTMSDLPRLTEQIITLIFEGQHVQAKALIENGCRQLPDDEVHRLTALSAVLQVEMGNIDTAIALLREALEAKPEFLPHLHRLSRFLMDAGRVSEASAALNELISLSERNDDSYFLNDARFRYAWCLKALGRKAEMLRVKKAISPGISADIGGKLYGLEDLN